MRAPVLAMGDGALRFWKAVRDVFPDTKEQRCWWHKIGNVLASLNPGAKNALAEIYNAENKTAATAAAKRFADDYERWPSRPGRGSTRSPATCLPTHTAAAKSPTTPGGPGARDRRQSRPHD
jgi:transposase-like protein